MKTVVSIPDKLFKSADRLAKRMRTSPSRLLTRALAEFMARYHDGQITDAINCVVDEVGGAIGQCSHKAARDVLRKVEW